MVIISINYIKLYMYLPLLMTLAHLQGHRKVRNQFFFCLPPFKWDLIEYSLVLFLLNRTKPVDSHGTQRGKEGREEAGPQRRGAEGNHLGPPGSGPIGSRHPGQL